MKGISPILGWILIVLALIVSFAIDLGDTERGGSMNFRNRITGIRIFEHGLDPYFYKWHEGAPPEFLDLRNNPNEPVSKTTVTPTMLLLHAPLAALQYRCAQFLWLILQWAFLLGTGWLWWRECTTSLARWLVALFITGFSYTVEWRWHAERGQAYVMLGFLFACWLLATMNPKRGNSFGSGFLAGFLVTLRPTFALLLPFAVLHRRGQLVGMAVGLLLGFALPVILHPKAWSEYSAGMAANSKIYRTNTFPTPDLQKHPAVVEGEPIDTLAGWQNFSIGNFSVHSLLLKYKLEPFPPAPVLIAFGLPFVLWLWFSRGQPVPNLVTGLAAWFFLADFFLPAARYSYYDVLILNAVLSGIALTKKVPLAAWACFLALPLGWAVMAASPERPSLMNQPSIYLTLGAVLFLFSFLVPAEPERAKIN